MVLSSKYIRRRSKKGWSTLFAADPYCLPPTVCFRHDPACKHVFLTKITHLKKLYSQDIFRRNALAHHVIAGCSSRNCLPVRPSKVESSTDLSTQKSITGGTVLNWIHLQRICKWQFHWSCWDSWTKLTCLKLQLFLLKFSLAQSKQEKSNANKYQTFESNGLK